MSNIKVSYKDLNIWVNGRRPFETYRQLQELWETSIKHPSISLSLNRVIGYAAYEDIIYLNPKDVMDEVNLMIKHGLCESFDQALCGLYGEECTHYISHQLVPDNSSNFLAMLDSAIKKSDGKLLVDTFNVGAQFECMGKIGRSNIVSKLCSRYSFSKECEKQMERIKQRKEFVLSGYGRALSSLSRSAEYAQRISNLLSFQIPSAAGYKVARVFQERFADKLGELIRQKLKPDPTLNPIILEVIDLYEAREFYSGIKIDLK
jgi:hypothetical protein